MNFTNKPGEVIFLNKDSVPSEDNIVNAALVTDSYDGITEPKGRHDKLLAEMVRAGHWGCLDHQILVFKIKTPVFVARQIMRASNTSLNEVSGRYKKIDPLFYMPEVFYTDVKRKELGEEPVPVENQDLARELYMASTVKAWDAYQSMLGLGVRKEQARMVMPLNMYTEYWMSLRLSDWLHFLNLRLDSHAQMETQHIARLIRHEIKDVVPRIIDLWELYAKGPINEYGTIQTP